MGAAGYIDNIRYTNTRNLSKYTSGSYERQEEVLTKEDKIKYEFILGLRLTNGINKDNFNNEINGEMVLVDFFAKWCGPCRMISPIVEELSNEINYVSFCKVDVDESGEIANTFGVLSIPTLLLFKEGKLISKKVGFQSKDELTSWINENK